MMQRVNSKFYMLVSVAFLAAGCAGLANDVPIDWVHGARRGVVTQIIDRTTKPEELPACLARLSATVFDEQQYVLVRYKHHRRYLDEAGAMPAGTRAKVGDMVEFYPRDCDGGAVSTLVRVLPPKAQ